MIDDQPNMPTPPKDGNGEIENDGEIKKEPTKNEIRHDVEDSTMRDGDPNQKQPDVDEDIGMDSSKFLKKEEHKRDDDHEMIPVSKIEGAPPAENIKHGEGEKQDR